MAAADQHDPRDLLGHHPGFIGHDQPWYAPEARSVFVHVEAMDNQGLTISGHFGHCGGCQSADHLHTQVLVQGHKWQVAGGHLDDVPVSEQGRFGVRAGSDLLDIAIQELRHNAGHAAGGMLADQIGESFFGVFTLQQFCNVHRIGRFIQVRPRWQHLDAAYHVAADHRQQRHWAGADNRAEPFLQHLQQVAFGQVHLEDGMQDVVPDVGLRTHMHGQRDEVIRSYTVAVDHRTLEVALRFQRGDLAAEHVNSQAHASPPRSRRSSSREPAAPTSTN